MRSLMAGFAGLVARLKGAEIDPVLAAAAIAFAFVFTHPFEDGNGRIHRYLIHHTLDEAGFTPPGILFPVSAAIVRNQAAYNASLERFSRAITRTSTGSGGPAHPRTVRPSSPRTGPTTSTATSMPRRRPSICTAVSSIPCGATSRRRSSSSRSSTARCRG
nr:MULTISPECIES: Fic family protein [unclassified Azospirillum]